MRRSIICIFLAFIVLLGCISVSAANDSVLKPSLIKEYRSRQAAILAANNTIPRGVAKTESIRKTAQSKGVDESWRATGYISSSKKYYNGSFTLDKPALLLYEMTFTGNTVLFSIMSGKEISADAEIVSMSPDTGSFYGGKKVGGSYLEPGDYRLFVAYDYYPGSFTCNLYASYFNTTEHEPNNSVPQAMNLSLDTSVSGIISATDSYDYYKINVPYDDLLTLYTSSTASYIGLSILNSSGNYLTNSSSFRIDGGYEDMKTATISSPVEAGVNYVVVKKPPCTDVENIFQGILLQGYYATTTSLGPQSVKINCPYSSVAIDEQMQLTTTVAPAGAANVVTWHSSDPAIATIDDYGLLTGVNLGSVTITATTRNSKTAKASVQIRPRLATGLMIHLPGGTSAAVGIPIQMEASFTPTNTTNKKLRWASSNNKVATISAEGMLTPMKKGSTTITATTQDGSLIQASCKVTVVSLAQQITVKGKDFIKAGKTAKYKAQVFPKNANMKKVTWSLSDTSVGTISPKGVVKIFKDAPTTTVTVIATAMEGTGISGSKVVTIR